MQEYKQEVTFVEFIKNDKTKIHQVYQIPLQLELILLKCVHVSILQAIHQPAYKNDLKRAICKQIKSNLNDVRGALHVTITGEAEGFGASE